MKRPLRPHETRLIRAVAQKLADNEARQLLEDSEQAYVLEEFADGSRITFGINGYIRPPYKGQRSYGIEYTLQDKDGAEVSVDIFSDQNGRLLEIELVRWGHGPLISPNWKSITL